MVWVTRIFFWLVPQSPVSYPPIYLPHCSWSNWSKKKSDCHIPESSFLVILHYFQDENPSFSFSWMLQYCLPVQPYEAPLHHITFVSTFPHFLEVLHTSRQKYCYGLTKSHFTFLWGTWQKWQIWRLHRMAVINGRCLGSWVTAWKTTRNTSAGPSHEQETYFYCSELLILWGYLLEKLVNSNQQMGVFSANRPVQCALSPYNIFPFILCLENT